ncbi:hypothetical protein Ahy_A05g025171 [Arachis hypogaea]|uniref:Transposase MuDR plant domain-containing protein n=1 Tax=Arachis hypogaea TaxID=3818 RepID=A0A445D7N8_ARAHY|nr:hypothetical protein Ahy_A05g025171 [Arachis hypogaea]
MNYNTKSGEDVEEDDIMVERDVADVANTLTDQYLSKEPSFIHTLNLNNMHVPKFPEYVNTVVIIGTVSAVAADDEFIIEMEFNSRETVIVAVNEYTIGRYVDYRVYESKPTTFYAKCVQYETRCD